MKKKILGRTGLEVPVAGLGCGGFSRLGSRKYGEEHAVDMVRYAYEVGVNLFDTAIQYETQPIVGKGLKGFPRDSYILSTKYEPVKQGNRDPKKLEAALDNCLKELRTDYIDIFSMHIVPPDEYEFVKQHFYPEMLRFRDKGKIRYIGITEDFFHDPEHSMLKLAAEDGIFDSLLVGYNILNPSAAFNVLPIAKEKNLGVMCMYAIRSTFREPAALSEMLQDLRKRGKIDENVKDLDFLIREGWAKTLPEAGLRFCANTDGIHTVLSGCGTPEHLDENIASITGSPLPSEIESRLKEVFKNSDAVPET